MRTYELIFNYRDNKHYNNDLLNLIKKTNNSCMETWMVKGHWDDNYVPFALINEKGDIIISIGVIKFSLFLNNTRYSAIQIGQPLIKEGHEDINLVNKLLELIINKYENMIDIMYSTDKDMGDFLMNNFGFHNINEKRVYCDWNPNNEPSGEIIKKIDTESSKDLDSIQSEIKHSTRISPVIATSGDSKVKLFNILKHFRKNVYYIPSLDTTAVFSFKDGIFQLAGVYSKTNIDIIDLLNIIVPSGINKIEFGFIPNLENLERTPVRTEDSLMTENTGLYLKTISAPIDVENVLIPVLSRFR